MDYHKKVCRKCKSNHLFWLFRCKRYTKERKICLDSGRFARSSCPNALLVRIRISDLPTGYCNIKHGPPAQLVFATGFEHGSSNSYPGRVVEGDTRNDSKEEMG